MYKKGLGSLAVFAAIALAMSAIAAEPDGRVAFRTVWVEDKDAPAGVARLRVTMTAIVPLTEPRVSAAPPAGVGLALRSGLESGAPWPVAGLSLGDLAAGQTFVLEIDVVKPQRGGGVVSFALEGTVNGKPIRESVGVYVGAPRVQPVVRDGVVEYPAEREDATP